jgi:hypothetical protein
MLKSLSSIPGDEVEASEKGRAGYGRGCPQGTTMNGNLTAAGVSILKGIKRNGCLTA